MLTNKMKLLKASHQFPFHLLHLTVIHQNFIPPKFSNVWYTALDESFMTNKITSSNI